MEDNDWLGEMPSLDEQISECRRLLTAFDEVPGPQMDALFYQHGYEELRINLGLLLDVLDAELGGGAEPVE